MLSRVMFLVVYVGLCICMSLESQYLDGNRVYHPNILLKNWLFDVLPLENLPLV